MYVAETPFEVEGNPAFVARKRVPTQVPEQEFFALVMRATEVVARQGLPIDPETVAAQHPKLTRLIAAEVMRTEKFQVACLDRGIEVSDRPGLTTQQLAALAVYTDMSRPMTHAQKLRAAGVTQAMWTGWLRQQAFNDELRFLSTENVKAAVQVGEQRLAEHVEAGNMQAIEFVFAMTGRFRKDAPAVDVRAMLLELFNILDEEGVPARAMERVGAKIKAMLGEPVVLEATVLEPQSLEQGAG